MSVTQQTYAELIGTFPKSGGRITVAPTGGPIQTPGLEFVASAGTLTPGTDPTPFLFFIPNEFPTNVSLGGLGRPLTIDGPITLDVTASADAVVYGTWCGCLQPLAFPVRAIAPEPNGQFVFAFGLLGLLAFR